MTQDDENQFDDSAAAAARAQAEARRKKILEKANQRMGVVSGEMALTEEDKQASASKAARIRAARARRYGKKTVTTATAAAEEEDGDVPPKVEKEETAEGTSPAQSSAPTPTDSAPTEEAATASAPEETPSGKTDETKDEEPKKKYAGVAKTRRKMILKKKKEEAAAESKSEADTSAPPVPVTAKPALSKLPVYMHIVVIMLLFTAGMDVGLQLYHEDVESHTTFAVKEHGVPILHRPFKRESTNVETNDMIQKLQEENNADVDATTVTEDELFDEEDDVDEDASINLDPLFGVDLDKLTEGPGLFNTLARSAVAIHRLILWAFYYTPIKIFSFILALPQTIVEHPPVLCFAALFIRQVIGKVILGASLPEPEKDKKNNAIDVLAMIRNGVTTFLSATFPTAVGFYGAFSQLRSDMYIVLCGVFVGIVWDHFSLTATVPAMGTDEL